MRNMMGVLLKPGTADRSRAETALLVVNSGKFF
jgi:hypothetical protein